MESPEVWLRGQEGTEGQDPSPSPCLSSLSFSVEASSYFWDPTLGKEEGPVLYVAFFPKTLKADIMSGELGDSVPSSTGHLPGAFTPLSDQLLKGVFERGAAVCLGPHGLGQTVINRYLLIEGMCGCNLWKLGDEPSLQNSSRGHGSHWHQAASDDGDPSLRHARPIPIPSCFCCCPPPTLTLAPEGVCPVSSP